MYLKYVQIVNYKNLQNARFEFGKGANTVIGENDAGKSNAMTAMRILLDSDYYYNTKRLKESDFSYELDDWRGHWIIISAFFDEITDSDKVNEICANITPEQENEDFLKSYIRCAGNDYGVVTLFIRPNKNMRKQLSQAIDKSAFDNLRSSISLDDYEFFYTARSQADFTDPKIYEEIVGDFVSGRYADPEDDNSELLGSRTDILNIWEHISLVYIDAMRDAKAELRKPKNPLRRIFDVIQHEVEKQTVEDIRGKIRDLNQSLSEIPQVANIGNGINDKLNDIVGLVYSPEVSIESHIKEDIESISRNLAITPSGETDIDQLGLGHLNILYIALKLVEFEVHRNHEILNIMIIEEPEAHIHTHIQRTLFENLNVSQNYTQVIMTTHSTHLSEVSNIRRVNILKRKRQHALVMNPIKGLNQYGKDILKQKDVSFDKCLERYLDAKRSVLLFSKAVLLVEGDGEEILIPSLVRQSLGISLDELGIGLINVGSVAFEYIASIFSDERLQRRCAIVTDLDDFPVGADKGSVKAQMLGINRQKKLSDLYAKNEWVESFFAPHTLEIDFYEIIDNQKILEQIIREHYVQKATIEDHISAISATDAKRYDTVITVVNAIGKGWHATLLSEMMDNTVKTPQYLLQAIAFASQEIVTPYILRRMALKILECYEQSETIKTKLERATDSYEIIEGMDEFCKEFPTDDLAVFVSFWKEYADV